MGGHPVEVDGVAAGQAPQEEVGGEQAGRLPEVPGGKPRQPADRVEEDDVAARYDQPVDAAQRGVEGGDVVQRVRGEDDVEPSVALGGDLAQVTLLVGDGGAGAAAVGDVEHGRGNVDAQDVVA